MTGGCLLVLDVCEFKSQDLARQLVDAIAARSGSLAEPLRFEMAGLTFASAVSWVDFQQSPPDVPREGDSRALGSALRHSLDWLLTSNCWKREWRTLIVCDGQPSDSFESEIVEINTISNAGLTAVRWWCANKSVADLLHSAGAREQEMSYERTPHIIAVQTEWLLGEMS